MNKEQLDFLNSLIGPEGNHFKTIKDDNTFDLGTKISYLERAIGQDCQEFLESLDKLYQPQFIGRARKTHLDFIRALKAINDLYFNGLDDVEADEVQRHVQEMIHARIAELSQNHEEEVTEQKQAREISEAAIQRQVGWRRELDLPLNQRDVNEEENIFLERIESFARRLDQLTYKKSSDSDINVMEEMLKKYPPLFALYQLSLQYRDTILRASKEKPIPVEFVRKMEDAKKSIGDEQFSELNELMNNDKEVADLVYYGEVISLSSLLSLEQHVRKELLKNCDHFLLLVGKMKFPLDELLALEKSVRVRLFDNANRMDELVHKGHISIDELLILVKSLGTELFDHLDSIIRLINEARISIDCLLDLAPSDRLKAFLHSKAMTQLMKEANIPLDYLLDLKQPICTEIFGHSVVVTQLVREARIPFVHLISFESSVRAVLFAYSRKVVQLMEEGILSLNQLSYLSAEELQAVCADERSEQARSALNPKSLFFKQIFFGGYKGLLDRLINERYFKMIKENTGVNLGIKILYLERAITQNCQEFLESLDKVYNPALIDVDREAHISFIHALKGINDLYNAQFGRFNPEEVRSTIRNMIHERIAELSQDHEDDVTKQKQAREAKEENIKRQVGWRRELELPLNPREIEIELDIFLENLMHIEYNANELAPEARAELISVLVCRFPELLELYHFSIQFIQTVKDRPRDEQLFNEAAQLLEQHFESIEDRQFAELKVLLAFERIVSTTLDHALTLDQCVLLPYAIKKVVYLEAEGVRQLIQEGGVTFTEIQQLSAQELKNLLERKEDFIRARKERSQLEQQLTELRTIFTADPDSREAQEFTMSIGSILQQTHIGLFTQQPCCSTSNSQSSHLNRPFAK